MNPTTPAENHEPFHSRPNEELSLPDGRTIWLSRAVAALAVITAYDEETGKHYVAVHRRGSGTPDHQGKLALSGGYVDWEESLSQAAVRETFQEIGLDLYEMEKSGYCTIPDQPYYIESRPDQDARENISARFLFEMRVPQLPELNCDNNGEPNESEDPQWLEITDQNLSQNEFAFNHERVIRQLNAEKNWFL